MADSRTVRDRVRDCWDLPLWGSVSFDCVNGLNAHLPVAAVKRRWVEIEVWWHSGGPHGRGPGWREVAVRHHPFLGMMGLRGILTVFGRDGSVLAEDVVRVRSVVLYGAYREAAVDVRAACYRYHPRPIRRV